MQSMLNDVTVLFLSILLEALPFLLLGSIIASAINLFVSDSLLYRIIPKNRLGGLVTVSLLGLIFPVCDCTIIPIMRRLIRKGLPPSLGVTFMCAVPIVNPAVLLSTYWAFTSTVQIVWLRMFVGLWTAIAAGYIVGKVNREADPVKDSPYAYKYRQNCCCETHSATDKHEHTCSCDAHKHAPSSSEESSCSCGHNHHYETHFQTAKETVPQSVQTPSLYKKCFSISGRFLEHTTHEFIDSAALIIVGALLSAIIQIIIPRTMMYPVASSPVGSVGAMMAFTWVISLCANADAFVAKSFYGLFTTGSVVAFMTFGQMIDLKNTIVMLGFFRKRFVVITISVIVLLCLAWGVAINVIRGGA